MRIAGWICAVMVGAASGTVAQDAGLSDGVLDALSDVPARDAEAGTEAAIETGPRQPAPTIYPQTTDVFDIRSETVGQATDAVAQIAAFHAQISACWLAPRNAPAVVVGFQLTPEGRVIRDSISLLAADRNAGALVRDAYASARQAILRCQGDGFDIPEGAYALWRDIEVTFGAWDPLQ